MNTNLIITDNFYQNPDETREWVLKQEFGVIGNFPGQRTAPVGWKGLRNSIQSIVKHAAGNITRWDTEYTESFQYTTKKDSSWIHADYTTMWAGVLYLTPNAPASGGTGLFRHKETGYERAPRLDSGGYDLEKMKKTDVDSRDFSKWDMTAMVGNIYNRLVLYRGDMFHTSLDYFGKDKNDGRLFQTFFFDTEY
jgi:hypothetical protein